MDTIQHPFHKTLIRALRPPLIRGRIVIGTQVLLDLAECLFGKLVGRDVVGEELLATQWLGNNSGQHFHSLSVRPHGRSNVSALGNQTKHLPNHAHLFCSGKTCQERAFGLDEISGGELGPTKTLRGHLNPTLVTQVLGATQRPTEQINGIFDATFTSCNPSLMPSIQDM